MQGPAVVVEHDEHRVGAFGELQRVTEGKESAGGRGGHAACRILELVESHGDDHRDGQTPMPAMDLAFQHDPEYRAEGVVVSLRSSASVTRCRRHQCFTFDRRIVGVARR